MNNKSIKIYISVIIVIIVLCSFNILAFAQDPFSGVAIGGLGGASAGGLFGSMAGLSGVNVGYVSDPVNDAMWNNLNSESVYFSGEKHEATMQGEDIYDYIVVNQADFQDAQEGFVEEFITNYNVQDNDSGSISGILSFNGIPMTQLVNNYYWSSPLASTQLQPTVGFTTAMNYGSFSIQYTMQTTSRVKRDFYYNGNLIGSTTSSVSTNNPQQMILTCYKNSPHAIYLADKNAAFSYLDTQHPIGQNALSGNIVYTSTTVNPDVFNDWESAKISIPHSQSGLNPNWTVQEFIESINNAWTNHQQNIITIEDTSSPVPPVPPTPIPTTPLGEVPYDEWVDTWGQHVIDNQESGNDALENIDTNIQTGNDTLTSIDTNIGTTNGILGQIKDLIQSGINSITNILNQILSAVQTLVQSIVNATETLIAGILNQIPIAFQSAWNTLKQSVSIWHYVVEWVNSISSVLSWVWTMASGTSYYIILPVYASLAGAVVLALYKKFGR